ncbi:hypothetical protein D7B24_003346 [Verticillium nonalfalfae]|uniref:Carbohydrate esterase family 5 protein n=1 Tax=Verticillium nonalfalfae TaxID=1051616 RepID=A0A3M9XY38_9PEZI|nr:uncharacterized protein D7B24_003346 [Verticillium nonalfalfae]RNJ52526.1 hypothetical protein D7B24_003346 [Verticillium nonalfalfae]
MITRYTKVCPESKIALLGYSQGAQITSNNLCGTPPVWLAGNPSLAPLPKSIIENHSNMNPVLQPRSETKLTVLLVVAVVLFGDPTFRSDDSFARGTAQGSGMFFRGNHTACNAVGDHIASYCDAGDPICDVESEVTETNMHVTYLERYLEESAEWVVERFSKGSSESPSPGGNNATTSAVVVPSALPTEQSNAAREVTSLLTVYIPALMVAVVMS